MSSFVRACKRSGGTASQKTCTHWICKFLKCVFGSRNSEKALAKLKKSFNIKQNVFRDTKNVIDHPVDFGKKWDPTFGRIRNKVVSHDGTCFPWLVYKPTPITSYFAPANIAVGTQQLSLFLLVFTTELSLLSMLSSKPS